MTMPKTTVRSSTLWQRAFIFAGWSIYALLTGTALLAALGMITPGADGSPLWLILIKGLIWPAAGHAIAGYVEHRTQRDLQSGLVWIPRPH